MNFYYIYATHFLWASTHKTYYSDGCIQGPGGGALYWKRDPTPAHVMLRLNNANSIINFNY